MERRRLVLELKTELDQRDMSQTAEITHTHRLNFAVQAKLKSIR